MKVEISSKRKKFISLVVICIFGIIPLLDFFHPGLPVTHDGIDQVARIANFYKALSDGSLIPRWAENLNWGYGHPILMFLYPLSSYIASFFHLLGLSFIDATKTVFIIGMLFSGITMYFWLSQVSENVESIFGAILYMVTPYRFVDVYVRGDIGENLSFVFLPLTFYFLVKLYRKLGVGYLFGVGISTSLLILSHNALSLMFLPLILFYTTYLFFKGGYKKKFILYALFGLLFGFCLSAFFWVPGLLEGKYTLRAIVIRGGYIKNFSDLYSLLYSKWSYLGSGQFSVQLGIVNWIGLFTGIVMSLFFFFKQNKRFLFLGFLTFYSLIAIFLMTGFSNSIWAKFQFLQVFQFPWRFLAITVFTSTVCLTLSIAVLNKKYRILCIIIFLFAILFFNKDYWHAKSYLKESDSAFTKVYHGTTDTGESAPIWSVRFMEKEPRTSIEIISGKGTIKNIKRISTLHTYNVILQTNARLKENTLYFPGWSVFLDGKPLPLQFQDPQNRGLITFYAPSGNHIVVVRFSDTKVRILADMVTLFSLATILIYGILKTIQWRHFR